MMRTFWMALALLASLGLTLTAQVAIRGERVHTVAGPVIADGVVVIRDGKVQQVGPASQVKVPAGYRLLQAKVVTPGLIDAHTVVGLSGYLNQTHDQEQVERTASLQPDLRAIDAYNPQERLVEWVRSHGVTTMHTGHGPGVLVSGQTMIVKSRGRTVDEAVMVPQAMIAVTIGESAREATKGPGTRAKMVALLRTELIKAQEYDRKRETAAEDKKPARDLRLEALARVLKREVPLLVTVHRAQDIMSALRVAKEFNVRLVLDGAAEAFLVLDQIKEAGVPVIVHPTMARSGGETENLSMETAAKLKKAGIPFAFQSGFESYVPKTRVVLYEAGVAAANGLTFDEALTAATLDAARLLGISDRVGSLEPGKDGDVVLYDGDPFEYTSHVVGVVIQGEVVSQEPR
ncbi:MAG TPA: amidohydrolase family protein [Terriglobia bacterium]|nr:amidohydrolase family protein [Terriglobia bacterium]